MSEFIQLHVLTSYGPSNLNRDDLNRPKTAVMGGVTRLRISSQSLKRAWRTSPLFEEAVAGHIGIRTKEMGVKIHEALTAGKTLPGVLAREDLVSRDPVSEKVALDLAKAVASHYGKLTKGKGVEGLRTEQLVHYAPEEIVAIDGVLANAGSDDIEVEDALPIRGKTRALDISMFGRMLADTPASNIEAAVQVAHALSVHGVVVEDDYFSAVDDLNTGEESAGSAHLGEVEFSAGLFYEYVCINRTELNRNVGGDTELATRGLKALIECIAKVAPTGKQNSFASRAYASYARVEKGSQQPRSLAVAFLRPVNAPDYLAESIARLEDTAMRMDTVYGACCDAVCTMNADSGEGSLADIMSFVEG
jgi:CRISPR system Cascade subunit CasC